MTDQNPSVASLAELSKRAFALWQVVRLFRAVALQGIDGTTDRISLRIGELLTQLDPFTKKISEIIQPNFQTETIEDVAKTAADTSKAVIGTSSIILAHAILDDLASELCRISADLDIDLWTEQVLTTKVDLRTTADYSFDDLRQRAVRDYVDKLSRESLLKRLDVLHTKYPPSANFYFKGSRYNYDREKVYRVDRKRQDILHKVQFSGDLMTIDADLDFMEDTCFYLIHLVTDHYRPHLGLGGLVAMSAIEEKSEFGLSYEGLHLASSLARLPEEPIRIAVWGAYIYRKNESDAWEPLPIRTPISQPSYSHDGKWVTYVRLRARTLAEREEVDVIENGEFIGDLYVSAPDGTDARLVLRAGSYPETAHGELKPFGGKIQGIEQPHFSFDDSVIYFIGTAWATSGAVYAVAVDSSAVRYVAHGNVIHVIEKPEYKSMLLINRHCYYGPPNYGSYDHFWLVSPDGVVSTQFGESLSEALAKL